MKGFSHFMSGVAVTSFCPWAVEAALNGNPLYFILGGAFGILPDTADFKFYRFFYEHDVYVTPDPGNPDPQYIADEIARAVAQAYDENRYIRLKLTTIRLGADYWQQYVVRFDNEKGEVQVRFGPVVNTGQVPIPGTDKKETPIGRAKLKCKAFQTYEATTRVDIFDGPTFGLAPREDGHLDLEFLPWHRNWSHSLVVGVIFGLIFAAIAWPLAGFTLAWQSCVTISLAYAIHVLEDQLGHMGSNLFFPFTLKGRTPGLHLMHSGDGVPNFLTVWISCILIFWNLYRAIPTPTFSFGFLDLIIRALVVPGLIMGGLHWLLTRGQKAEKDQLVDTSDEWGETGSMGG